MAARRKKAAPTSAGLAAAEVAGGTPPAAVRSLTEQITAEGGAVLTTYREPFAGQWVVMASLPLDKVQPTPYQREMSQAHVDRLATVIPKVGRFLDPVIAVHQDKGFWTPNGMHRLLALKQLGAQSIVALVLPEHDVAFRILALNTEKAHNLKDKCLEVIRMAHALAKEEVGATRPEADWSFEFEEPAYLTLGLCYEERARFAGTPYLPVLRRCDEFSSAPLAQSLAPRMRHAHQLLELDDAVNEAVSRLRNAGFASTFLKPFVVAHINPLRRTRAKPGQKAPKAELSNTLTRMLAAARDLDPLRVKPQDIAAAGAVSGASTDEP